MFILYESRNSPLYIVMSMTTPMGKTKWYLHWLSSRFHSITLSSLLNYYLFIIWVH